MIRVKLSSIMGDKRMNQAELARKTGIRPATISEIYNELRNSIGLEQLDRICTALQCNLSDILEHQLEPPEQLKQAPTESTKRPG